MQESIPREGALSWVVCGIGGLFAKVVAWRAFCFECGRPELIESCETGLGSALEVGLHLSLWSIVSNE